MPTRPRRTGRDRRATSSILLLAVLVLDSLTPAPAPAQIFAEPLVPENIRTRRLGGPDSIAGLGDWVMGNGTLCAAISDPDHESVLSPRGGVLVDLGHCGRDDDHWGVLQPMLNLSRQNVLPVDGIRAETTATEARIVTHGHLDGARFETVYRLDLNEPRRLAIRTVLTRETEGDNSLFLFGDVALHGNRQLTPFTLSSDHPELSLGFAHPAVDVGSSLAMARAMVLADLHVLVAGEESEPGIAYGWRLVSAQWVRGVGESVRLPHLAMNGEHFSLLGVFTRPPWIGGDRNPGLIELAQTMFMDLTRGDAIVYEREIVVGDRSDVASVTSQIWSDGPLVRGLLDDASARIHVSRGDGVPLTALRPQPDGRFELRLPPGAAGRHALEIRTPDGRSLRREFEVSAGEIDLGRLAVGPPARVLLPEVGPVRLVFLGVPPTPDPSLGDDLFDFRVGRERPVSSTLANHVSLAGAPGDRRALTLAPGRYRVLASRGPEYEVSETRIELKAGSVTALEIDLPARAVFHPGWVSADLHVHSEWSDDSSLPLRARIAAFAAQGADLVVATEHDRIIDYAPVIRDLGLSSSIASLIGSELTSTVQGEVAPYTFGHANAFPLAFEPDQYRGGSPDAEDRRLRSVAADLRRREPLPILQVNHPREAGLDSGYGSFFTHLSVVGRPHDPTLTLEQEPNRALIERDPISVLRDLDFDAVELLNGPSMTRYRLTRADWLSFLLQGEFRTATANSDSHTRHDVVALPRNYVAYAGPVGNQLDADSFVAAVRAGRLYGSTGPLLDVRLDGIGPGQRFTGSRGRLQIGVRGASWIPVSEARVYVDGALRERIAITRGETRELALEFAADAFVTVEVEGRAEKGSIFAALAPGFTPFAFSNPVFVDADGDGRWRAPGLPLELPATLSDPLASDGLRDASP